VRSHLQGQTIATFSRASVTVSPGSINSSSVACAAGSGLLFVLSAGSAEPRRASAKALSPGWLESVTCQNEVHPRLRIIDIPHDAAHEQL
jgi:hypothetical protein